MRERQQLSDSSPATIFFLVLGLHILLYWCWPAHSLLPIWNQVVTAPPMMLRFFSTPSASVMQATVAAVIPKVLPVDSHQQNPGRNPNHGATLPAPFPSSEPVSAAASAELESAKAATLPSHSEEINRDVRGIFNELKKDIQQRDKLSTAPPVTAMTRLGQKISAAALVAREGVRFEQVQTFDGRPVTKVITPYGTYCVLQRKPGEIIGNEPMTVAVSCGTL